MNVYMQTCNMDERTNEEKLRDQIRTLELKLEKYKELAQIAFTLGEWTDEYRHAYECFKRLEEK